MSYKRHDGTSSKNNARRWKERNHYERHYCELCNAWMASDRQSILHHEQGAKHQSKLHQSMIEKRQLNEQKEKEQKVLLASLQHMEASAIATIGRDYGRFATTTPAVLATSTTQCTSNPPSLTTAPAQASKVEWNERKRRQREEAKRAAAKVKDKNDNATNSDTDTQDDDFSKRRKVEIGETEGSYEADSITWLEGVTFAEILEEEMPVQLWMGNPNCTDVELRLTVNTRYWKDAIIAAVRQRPNQEKRADRMVLDVAYLKEDGDEHVQKSVALRHVRIQLANASDDRIPDTLLEARLLAMGGEEIQVVNTDNPTSEMSQIQESTGFSAWSTIAIKRTTVRNERKAERDALRQKKREAVLQAKETDARRMEEAKLSNADDSALGAFDVWNRTTTGYKGVDIHSKVIVQVQDLAKKVAEGPVAFKKTSTFKPKKQNRRITSADD